MTAAKRNMEFAREYMRRLNNIGQIIEIVIREDREPIGSSWNFDELGVTVRSGSHLSPQETLTFAVDEGYNLAILRNDYEELRRMMTSAIEQAVEEDVIQSGAQINYIKALELRLYKGLDYSEVFLDPEITGLKRRPSQEKLKKIEKKVLLQVAEGIKTLRENKNKALLRYESWPMEWAGFSQNSVII